MHLKIFVAPILILIIFVIGFHNANAQTYSANLLNEIPESSQTLNSPDVRERVSILTKLVVRVPMSCIGELDLPVSLDKEDYSYVVGQILEKDLTALDKEAKPDVWNRLTYLIKKFQMKQFAEPISVYLKDQNISVQAQVITTLQQLQANEFDGEITPLLDSSEPYIRSIALEALISFRSKKAIPALIAKLYDANASQRYWAISKLTEINGKEAAPQIAKLIKDEDPTIRYLALDGIAKLNLKAQAKEIWYLLNTEQSSQTQAYAIAALVYFNDPRAIKIAAERIANWKEEYDDILKYITELKAKPIIPSLLSILDNEKETSDKPYGRYNHIIYCLNALEARESISVLRKYMHANPHAREPVIGVLGHFEAKEAVDDLLEIFYKYLPNPPSSIQNETYESAEAAVALAEIGDPKTWKILIDAAENPKYPYRSQIIQILNKKINLELWKKTQEIKVKGIDYKNIKENSEILSGESGIPIILEFDPKKNITRGVSPDNPQFPQLRAGMEISLKSYLESIVGTIDAGTLPNTFTFIFDSGQIRIITVENAVQWWRKNFLKEK
jgi:HEAT repeat protein